MDMTVPPLSSEPYLTVDPEDGRPRLAASECVDCGKRVFPPTPVCPDCMGENMAPLLLSRDGSLYSFTVIEQGPFWVPAPYIAGYIDMPEGVRIFTHITDVEAADVVCDMPVRLKITESILNSDGRDVLKFMFVPTDTGDS